MTTIIISPVNLLQIVFSTLFLFSSLILLPKKSNRRLIYLLTASSSLMFFNLLENMGITNELYLFTPSFSLIFGPLFYFLVRQLALNELTCKSGQYYHFVPALLSLLFTQYVQFVLAIGTVSQLIYFALSLKLLKTYKKGCFDNRSDALSLQIDWLNNILYAMIVITLVDLLRLNLQPVLNISLANSWYFTMQLAYYLLTSYLVVQAIWQPSRFTGLQYYLDQQEKNIKDQNSARPIFAELNLVILTEKLYQQPKFSLQDLANYTGMSSKDISWAINDGCQLNFCDYINRHRIEEIKAKLDDKVGKNLLEVAFDAGFNSKSSFNKSFKKQVGITPSQYIKSVIS
jgi:AraC-like DNA-binding protein